VSWVKKRLPLRFAEGFQIQGSQPLQEDYFELNADRGIFLLADGFGGTPGRSAAELSVKSARQFMEQEAGDLDATLPFELRPYYSLAGNVLLNAIRFANEKVLLMNRDRSWEQSGGASLVAGYLEGRLLSIAQVGSCRIHLKRGEVIKELVAPRSLLSQVNPFLEEGEGDAIPLMSIGTSKRLEPEISEIELRPGDEILISSSGVRKEFREGVRALPGQGALPEWMDQVRNRVWSNSSMIWLGF